MRPCAGPAGAEQVGSCWEPWSRAKCHDALQPEPVLQAQRPDWATCHTHVLGTHLVGAHSLWRQGPLPIQRVGRGQRTGAPGPRGGGEAEPVQQGVEPLVPGTNHTGLAPSITGGSRSASSSPRPCPTRPSDRPCPTLRSHGASQACVLSRTTATPHQDFRHRSHPHTATGNAWPDSYCPPLSAVTVTVRDPVHTPHRPLPPRPALGGGGIGSSRGIPTGFLSWAEQ